jgi:hypothetical protein
MKNKPYHRKKRLVNELDANKEFRCQVSGVGPAAGQNNSRSDRIRNFKKKANNE